ncbi:hypothetical protein DMA11_14560 [Marinilabiliaceae bacterium JC017]|nr:hypothetical protein DMA11_14560 [Marinilabiliaceae bacterium JC017]
MANSNTMIKNTSFVFLVLLFSTITLPFSNAQKVGLVLSGGGAKGLAHIGIIRTLEENGIPIDYVAGTSMGAIIAGLYAIGYTPDEMEELLKSKEMKAWYTGEISEKYIFYFKKPLPNPSQISVPLLKEDSVVHAKLPSHLVPSGPMDFAFLELFAQANAACNNDFDQLMVPLRTIASDIYAKKEVVLKQGDIGDAIRASMTYPLFFKPIKIDNTLLFDGGIYNNFPTDVMMNDFKPDFIIGSKVARNTPKPEEDDIWIQLENLVMGKTNYNIPQEQGVLIETNFTGIQLLDFDKADLIIEEGAMAANAMIDSLKTRIKRRVNPEDINTKRELFKAKIPNPQYKSVQFSGLTPAQIQYISRTLNPNEEYINIQQLKKAYYKLLAEPSITSIHPKSIYSQSTGQYQLMMNFKTRNLFNLSFGGNVSSSGNLQSFLGINYHFLSRNAFTTKINMHIGKLYSAGLVGVRIDSPSKLPLYYKAIFGYNHWDFSSINPFNNAIYLKRDSYLFDNEIGIPVSINGKSSLGFRYGEIDDQYLPPETTSTSYSKDETIYTFFAPNFKIERNTYNKKEFPSKGSFKSLKVSYQIAREEYTPSEESTAKATENLHLWWEAKGVYDRFFQVNKNFKLGIHGTAQLSTQPLMSNYVSSLAMSPGFYPNKFARSFFIPSLKAPNYGAIGIKPLFDFNGKGKTFFFLEAYYMLPYQSIKQVNNIPEYGDHFKDGVYLGAANLVWHTPIGPLDLSLNYCSKQSPSWYFQFNFGFLIFNPNYFNM